jgi:hypothetical protein
MRKSILTISFMLLSFYAQAYNPALDPAIKNVEECFRNNEFLICNGELDSELAKLQLDARGDFAIYLREALTKNPTEKVVKNLFTTLPALVQLYEKLDSNAVWSYRALKALQDDVSIEFVKIAPIDAAFLVELYKTQGSIAGRYGLLTTLSGKIASINDLPQMDNLIHFLEIAKEHSRTLGDETYLYNTAVELIGLVTVKAGMLRPGHEGIYDVTFDNAEAAKALNIDKIVVMEGNAKDSLVVNFVASQSRIVKISFTAAGMLGDAIFSNLDIYNDNQDTSNPYFKFTLDREAKTIKGVFATARHGEMTFSGKLISSNSSVYAQDSVKGLTLGQLLGTFKVKVGNYDMTLVLKKRALERSVVEAALYSDNAMISFSKVSLNSAKGVLTLVDYSNERKLTLAVVGFEAGVKFSGQFLNAAQSKVLEVTSK